MGGLDCGEAARVGQGWPGSGLWRRPIGYNHAVGHLDTLLDLSPRKLLRLAARQRAALGRHLSRRKTVPQVDAGFLQRQDQKAEALLRQLLEGASLDDVLSDFDAKVFGERLVEYPVFFDWLRQQPTGLELLDVGCVLNKAFLGPFLAARCRALWLCNPALEPIAIEGLPVYYHAAALAEAFARERTFRAITCLSTLEHIGYDNSHYGVSLPARFTQPDETPFVESFAQLSRLLASGGRLLISFPYGRREVLIHPRSGRGASQVMDHAAVQRCMPVFNEAGVDVEMEVYAATAAGWKRQDPENDDFRYADGCPGAEAVAILKGHRT